MIRVKILKSWTSPDWLRQTPGACGLWGECQFSHEPDEPADYVVVCNHVPEDVVVTVPKERAWLVVQEPPVPAYAWIRDIYPDYGRIFTSDHKCGVSGLVQHQGGLPWHVDRSYDELTNHLPDFDAKSVPLTWVTSNQRAHRGHRLRMKFLDRLQAAKVPLELRGRGFTPVANKWDALAPARYALAIENHACPFYWTEKVADCFLSGAYPIYWGAPNLEEFFPAESFARIDITDPAAPRRVAEIVASDLALRNREALLEARRRMLEEHNFFSWMSRAIADHARSAQSTTASSTTHRLHGHPDLASYYLLTPRLQRLWHALRRRLCR